MGLEGIAAKPASTEWGWKKRENTLENTPTQQRTGGRKGKMKSIREGGGVGSYTH